MAVFVCEHCEHTREVDEKYLHKKVHCPKCRETSVVGTSPVEETTDVEEHEEIEYPYGDFSAANFDPTTASPGPRWKCSSCSSYNAEDANACSKCGKSYSSQWGKPSSSQRGKSSSSQRGKSLTAKPNIGLSVVACVLFPLFGLTALIYSVLAEVCILRKDYTSARNHAAMSGGWRMAAFASFGAIVLVLAMIFFIQYLSIKDKLPITAIASNLSTKEEFFEEICVPTGSFSFSFQTSLRSVPFDQAENKFSQKAKVLGAVPVADATGIFIEYNI